MMLLHLLLHVLIFHLLTAKGGPRDSGERYEKIPNVSARDLNYVIRYIEQCPDVGYYFRRERSPNSIEPGPCYLCFCQGEYKAVCWRRENKRCNLDSCRHRRFGKRDASISHGSALIDTRVRRSPGFADIFFRDASRDVFNKNTAPEQCKPYESSFSDDCPPVDWCVGCTVCDCDANGRWDCHILSFCSDDEKGKKGKTKDSKGSKRKTVKKKPVRKAAPIPKATPKPKTIKKQPIKHLNNKINSVNTNQLFKKASQVKAKVQKKKPSIRYQKNSTKVYTTKSVKFINKNVATHKPIEIMGNRLDKIVKVHQNNTVFLAKEVVKKVMATVRQMVQKEMLNMTMLATGKKLPITQNKTKIVKKSPVNPKPRNNYKTKARASGKKVNKRQIQIALKKASSVPLSWHKRSKRSLISEDQPPFTTNSTTMSTPEVIPVDQAVIRLTTTLAPVSNLLVPASENFTEVPVATTRHKNEYYKYVIATEKNLRNELIQRNDIDSNLEKVKNGRSDKSELNNKKSKYVENNVLNSKNIELLNNRSHKLSNIYQLFKINTLNTKDAKADKLRNDRGLKNHLNYFVHVDPEENDLKFNNWPKYNLLKEKNVPISVERSNNILKLLVNNSVDFYNKNKVHGKDIDRITVARKYNLVKIRNRHRCPFLDNFSNIVNKTNNGTKAKKTDLQDILVELLKEYKNNSRKASKKFRKFSVIRYLKKIFTSIFRRKNISQRFHRNHVIETLCENFGPCKIIEPKDKVLLQSKLKQLDKEAINILKIVRIIRGLLKLLNSTKPNRVKHSPRESFRNDMQRLSSILKDNYESHFKETLSMTQIIQINYIRKNTDDFVKSVSKFAVLLNEIVTVLTQKATTPNTKRQIQKPLTNNQLQTLKTLFLKYNIVQNIFMKSMYKILTNYEKRINDNPKVSAVQDMNSSVAIEHYSRNILKNLRKLSDLSQTLSSNGRTKRETRDDSLEYLLMLMEYLLKQNHPLDTAPVNDGIDLLIDAIKNAPDIKTIRKKVLDYTLPPGQDTTYYYTETTSIFDQSTEKSYISTTKSPDSENNSFNNSTKLDVPENELKMEGIRDIFEMVEDEKDIEEKYQFDRRADGTSDVTIETSSRTELYDNEVEINNNNKETTTQLPLNQDNNNNEDVIENDNINQHNSTIYSLNRDSNNTELNYNEDSFDRKSQGNDNYNGYNYGDVTQSIYINNSTENVDVIETNIDSSEYVISNKSNINSYRRANKDNTIVVTDNPIVLIPQKRLQDVEKTDTRKFQPVYDFEERFVSMLDNETLNNTDLKSTTPSNQSKSIEIKTLDSDDSESLDKKAKLEWIEENFGREDKINEDKSENVDQRIKNTENIESRKTEATQGHKNDPKTDISSISSEAKDSNKNIPSKPNTDVVMLKKEMDLLNSLDYGTERGDFDEIESKDTGERFSDTFSTYYA